jgi:hypothetical protein
MGATRLSRSRGTLEGERGTIAADSGGASLVYVRRADPWPLVAGRAAQAFVDAGGRAVVAEDLVTGPWRVALVADGLALVGACLHCEVAVVHDRQREPVGRRCSATCYSRRASRR